MMTHAQAEWLARRRWGQFAYVEEGIAGSADTRAVPYGAPIYSVGMTRTGFLISIFGQGASWEAAFVDANGNGEAIHRLMRRVVDEIVRDETPCPR